MAPEFYQRIAEVEGPSGVPYFSLDLSCSQQFSSHLATSLFGSSSPSEIVTEVSPLKRPIHSFTKDQLALKSQWEDLSAHFGHRNEESYQLSVRIGRLASSCDVSGLIAHFNEVNNGDDVRKAELLSSLKVKSSCYPVFSDGF